MEQVYIFDFGDKIKIGYSTNVKKRLRTIELSSGVEAKQVYSIPSGKQVEQLLLNRLENRMVGEFFACPFEQAKTLLDEIIADGVSPIRPKKPGMNYDKLFALMKEKGLTTYRIRKEGIISETTLQKLREGRNVTTDSIACLCQALACQPGDIMEYVEENGLQGGDCPDA